MGLRSILQQATREAHARVEAAARLDAPPDLARYRHFLVAQHRVLGVLEPLLLGATALRELGVDLGTRGRLAALEADLDYLGVRRPRPLRMIHPDHGPALLGCAYVIEGATLGSRVLAARWAGPLGFAPGRGASFLEAHGAHTGPRWSAFVAALEATALDAAQTAECVLAAEATFEAMERALRGAP